jgi:hypothetical protein
MQSETAHLERDLETARKALNAGGYKAGKSSQAYENRYGIAYQRLVKAGARPQLRMKRRPRV